MGTMLSTSQDSDQPTTRPASGVPTVTNQPRTVSRRATLSVNGPWDTTASSSREKSSRAMEANSVQGSRLPRSAARCAAEGLF